MSKKSKIITAIVAGSLLLVGGLAWLGMYINRIDQASIAYSRVATFLKTEDLQFTGNLKTPQYTADFTTTIKGDISKSEITLQYSSLPRGPVKGQIIDVNGKTFFKVDDVSTLIDVLPKDPLSQAIRTNIEQMANDYRSKWIKIDNDKHEQGFKNCLVVIRYNKVDFSNNVISFSKYPFFRVNNISEKDGIKIYEGILNNQLPVFLADATGVPAQQFEACKAEGTTLEISFNEQTNQIVKIESRNDGWVLVLSGFKYEDLPAIEAPKASMPLSSLKKSLDNLFIL